jgi:hypothetical protein
MVSSVTTVAPKEVKRPKPKKRTSEAALAETATSKPAEEPAKSNSQKADSSNLTAQQKLLLRLLGLLR